MIVMLLGRREPRAAVGRGWNLLMLSRTSMSTTRAVPSCVDEASQRKPANERRTMDLLNSAIEEVRTARDDMGWGTEGFAMRLTMLMLPKKRGKTTGVPQEATMVDRGEAPVDRITEWERLLTWAHASYRGSERAIAKQTGLQPGEIELVKLSTGSARGRPMAPTYVLAVDHRHKEIVLSVRGTKAFGDAITISHFLPEPFLDGYAHRGFAQSAHELVREVEVELTVLRQRLPNYRICFTGHSMGGGIAAMASLLIRDSVNRGGGRNGGKANDHLRSDEHGRFEVVSFATPACVSLELARRCQTWVKSIVYADDAVPRLSTVSLDLLKENMTAEEWTRAVDRLSRLSSPSVFSIGWFTKAFKEGVANFAMFGRTRRRSATPPGATEKRQGVGVEDRDRDGRESREEERCLTSPRFNSVHGSPLALGVTRAALHGGRRGGKAGAWLDIDAKRKGWSEPLSRPQEYRESGRSRGRSFDAADVLNSAGGNGAGSTANGASPKEAVALREQVELHSMLTAREEASYLPLYPPGDPFLMCNAARAGTPVPRQSLTGEARGEPELGNVATGIVRMNGRKVSEMGMGMEMKMGGAPSPRVTDGLLAVQGVDERRGEGCSAPAMKDSHVSHDEEKPASRSLEASEMSKQHPSGRGVVLVRVPHQHFLRMPLTPCMISDHTMSAYRYGLAGLKER